LTNVSIHIVYVLGAMSVFFLIYYSICHFKLIIPPLLLVIRFRTVKNVSPVMRPLKMTTVDTLN